MITRLEVDGFKSLRNFAVDLEPFTVFIGPNSAGKSNILDALALLSRLASQPITEAFKNGRGRPIDQFSRYGGESAREMRFAVELLEYGPYPKPIHGGGYQSRFRYQLTIERQVLPSGDGDGSAILPPAHRHSAFARRGGSDRPTGADGTSMGTQTSSTRIS